jgi:glycosyltransferase involved in cell wall biosynthesis
MKRIGVVVLAYNVAPFLSHVIERIPASVLNRIEELIVLDDASDDDTPRVAQALKATPQLADKLTILRNPTNLGYGGNQKRGYRYAIERGLDIVVLLHGDGQYAPEVMQQLLRPVEEQRAELVMGSRMLTPGGALAGNMPLYKYVGNRILTGAQNWLLGTQLSEFHSGYRVYATEVLAQLPFENFADSYYFDTQVILELLRHNWRILEVPIPTHYGEQISYLSGLPYAWHCFRTTAAFALATGRWPRMPAIRRLRYQPWRPR